MRGGRRGKWEELALRAVRAANAAGAGAGFVCTELPQVGRVIAVLGDRLATVEAHEAAVRGGRQAACRRCLERALETPGLGLWASGPFKGVSSVEELELRLAVMEASE